MKNNQGVASVILLIALVAALVAGGGLYVARKTGIAPSPTPGVILPTPSTLDDTTVVVTAGPIEEPTIDPKAPTTTITGVAVCLPHKGNGDAQTLECAFGIKDSKGDYYSVDLTTDQMMKVVTGNTYQLVGVLEPVGNSTYVDKGKIRVKTMTDLGKK